MSWLVHSVTSFVSSFFASPLANEAEKKRKTRQRGQAFDDEPDSYPQHATSPRTPLVTTRRSQQELVEQGKKMRRLLTSEEVNAVILSFYDDALASVETLYLPSSKHEELYSV